MGFSWNNNRLCRNGWAGDQRGSNEPVNSGIYGQIIVSHSPIGTIMANISNPGVCGSVLPYYPYLQVSSTFMGNSTAHSFQGPFAG